MAVDQFAPDAAHHVRQVEPAGLAGDLGVEDDLEEQVAQFLRQCALVVRVERVQHFAGFLQQVLAQGAVGLFAVPRAAVWGAQAGDYFHETFHRGLRLQRREV
jgi:hypothetical protein